MYDDYSNGGKATRPSFIEAMKSLKGTNRPPKDRVDLLAARYAAGQDLWTGKPLRPTDTAVIPVPDEDTLDMENPIMTTSFDTPIG